MSMNVPPPDASGAAAAVEIEAVTAAGDDVIGEAGPITHRSYDMTAERRQARKERRRLLLRRPGFVIGVSIILAWIVCGIGGDKITPHDPLTPVDTSSLSPRAGHLMGTDQLGRDVLSRVMAGARDVLLVAPLAATLAVVAGTFLGLLMGYYRSWVDEVLSRLIEVLLSIPVVLMALLIVATLGSSRIVVIGTVAVLFTPIVTRTVRAAVLAEAQLDYVTSARLRGEKGLFVMTREILPNITPTILVEYTVRIGYAVFTVATLSFLGAGIQPPSPDWGLAVSDTYALIPAGQWWGTLFPALAIASVVVATNLVADSIEAALAA